MEHKPVIIEDHEETPTLCDDNYFYCSTDDNFPEVKGIPEEWYAEQSSGQIEFRKLEGKDGGQLHGWKVTPVLYFELGEKEFPSFMMSDLDVLSLWVKVVSQGGLVSDGVINLFETVQQ